MQTSAASGYRWKSQDLDRLPDEPFLTYEIIDGELIVSRQPHLRHGVIIATVSQLFLPAVKALGGLASWNQELSGAKRPRTTSYPMSPSCCLTASI